MVWRAFQTKTSVSKAYILLQTWWTIPIIFLEYFSNLSTFSASDFHRNQNLVRELLVRNNTFFQQIEKILENFCNFLMRIQAIHYIQFPYPSFNSSK